MALTDASSRDFIGRRVVLAKETAAVLDILALHQQQAEQAVEAALARRVRDGRAYQVIWQPWHEQNRTMGSQFVTFVVGAYVTPIPAKEENRWQR